ncbi:MAG: WD40/YVTN/BNR-like repeat-containing protein, partial [Acidimicrobiales bacterium]
MRTLALAALLTLTMVGAAVVSPVATGSAATSTSGWQVAASYPAPPLPTAIACPSVAACVAVGGANNGLGGVILTTTDGGHTWEETGPTGVGTLAAVACPSTSDCTAVGYGSIVTTTDGGITWTSERVPSGVEYLNGIACFSVSDCTAVGGGDTAGGVAIATTNRGGTWSRETIPGVEGLNGVACPSASDCVAVGEGSGPTAAIL